MTGEHALRAASCQIPVIWSWFALLLVIPGMLMILRIHQQVLKSGKFIVHTYHEAPHQAFEGTMT